MDKMITDAALVGWVAAVLLTSKDLSQHDGFPAYLDNSPMRKVELPSLKKLNKKLKGNPKALFYWVLTIEMLANSHSELLVQLSDPVVIITKKKPPRKWK